MHGMPRLLPPPHPALSVHGVSTVLTTTWGCYTGTCITPSHHHTNFSPLLFACAGRSSECELLYRQALALCPTYPSAHYNLGVLASEGRRWMDALQHYKDTLALAPHHAQVGAHGVGGPCIHRLLVALMWCDRQLAFGQTCAAAAHNKGLGVDC